MNTIQVRYVHTPGVGGGVRKGEEGKGHYHNENAKFYVLCTLYLELDNLSRIPGHACQRNRHPLHQSVQRQTLL